MKTSVTCNGCIEDLGFCLYQAEGNTQTAESYPGEEGYKTWLIGFIELTVGLYVPTNIGMEIRCEKPVDVLKELYITSSLDLNKQKTIIQTVQELVVSDLEQRVKDWQSRLLTENKPIAHINPVSASTVATKSLTDFLKWIEQNSIPANL